MLSVGKQDDEIAHTTDMAKVVQKFIELEKDCFDGWRQYQNCLDLYVKTSYEIQLKRQALEAFSEAIKMFEEQMKLQERFQKEAQPHEISTWVFGFLRGCSKYTHIFAVNWIISFPAFRSDFFLI